MSILFLKYWHKILYYNILPEKLKGIRPHRKSEDKYRDNVKITLKVVRFEDVNYTHLVQDKVQWWAVVDMVKNLWVS
jgi:hypothetical protein